MKYQLLLIFSNALLIASAKSRSVRGASHHPAFMSGCLTISHMCLPCLPSERILPIWRHLFVVGSEVTWKRWDSSELGRWERCIGGVRWQVGKGGRIVRWHGWRGGNVMRWQFERGARVVSREGGMEFKDKIVLYCSSEAKCKQGFTAGI